MHLSHHLLIVKREALHRAKSIGGSADILEHDECLTSHFGRLQGNDVEDRAKLREQAIKRLLQLCNRGSDQYQIDTACRPLNAVSNDFKILI